MPLTLLRIFVSCHAPLVALISLALHLSIWWAACKCHFGLSGDKGTIPGASPDAATYQFATPALAALMPLVGPPMPQPGNWQ